MSDRCIPPITRGPRTGQTAQGTEAGYFRHVQNGEQACEACRKAHNAAGKARKSAARPEPAMSGAPLKTGKRFKLTGSTSVRCRGCGARGRANRAFVGRKRVVDSCVNCRDTT